MCFTVSSSVGGRQGLWRRESKISVLIEFVRQKHPPLPEKAGGGKQGRQASRGAPRTFPAAFDAHLRPKGDGMIRFFMKDMVIPLAVFYGAG